MYLFMNSCNRQRISVTVKCGLPNPKNSLIINSRSLVSFCSTLCQYNPYRNDPIDRLGLMYSQVVYFNRIVPHTVCSFSPQLVSHLHRWNFPDI